MSKELVTKIKNGQMNGELVWICDTRHNGDPFQKLIRNIKPTQVMVICNSETKKKIYYSQSHFAPLKKDGTPYKKVIGIFDGTGYRSYPGEPVNVFETEEECVACWKKQMLSIANDMSCKITKMQQKVYEFGIEFGTEMRKHIK